VLFLFGWNAYFRYALSSGVIMTPPEAFSFALVVKEKVPE